MNDGLGYRIMLIMKYKKRGGGVCLEKEPTLAFRGSELNIIIRKTKAGPHERCCMVTTTGLIPMGPGWGLNN